MLTNLKYYLYRKGWLKPKSTKDKIKLLLTFLDKIYLYDRRYADLEGKFVEKNIVEYIEELEKILIHPLCSKIVEIRTITDYSYTTVSYAYWYTYEGRIIDDNEVLKLWLTKSLSFLEWADEAKVDFNNTYKQNNFRRTAPYYHNITTIVNEIYNQSVCQSK